MKELRKCVICGKLFEANVATAKYCSYDCRLEASRRSWSARKERRKEARSKENKLDKALREAKAQGLTYAEYQKRRTLELSRKGKL